MDSNTQTLAIERLIKENENLEIQLNDVKKYLEDLKSKREEDSLSYPVPLGSSKYSDRDNSNFVHLSSEEKDYFLKSGTELSKKRVDEGFDTPVDSFTYLNLLDKLAKYFKDDIAATREGFKKTLTPREKETYRLALLEENYISPSFLGIYDCGLERSPLSQLYDKKIMNSPLGEYLIQNKDIDPDLTTITNCGNVCTNPKLFNFNNYFTLKKIEANEFGVKICVNIDDYQTKYSDLLKDQLSSVLNLFRVTREQSFISSESFGWLSASLRNEGFKTYSTSEAGKINPIDIVTMADRLGIDTKEVTVVMHPDVFRLFSTQMTQMGAFLVGERVKNGVSYITIGTSNNREYKLIKSDFLPAATSKNSNNTELHNVYSNGSLPSGSFAFAVADWKRAYQAVVHKDLTFKLVQSEALYCSTVVAGAKYTGYIKCPRYGAVCLVK